MFPITFKREAFLGGELISTKLIDVAEETHWIAHIEEITNDPVAPLQYWIIDNRQSYGTGGPQSTRYAVAKFIEAGAKEILMAFITDDEAYQPQEFILNEIASIEGLPFAGRIFKSPRDALDWFKKQSIQRKDTLR